MRIRHISIKNFRGIKELDWKVTGDFVCLIGPGDSTKSTILDAIECALYPRWNFPAFAAHRLWRDTASAHIPH